MKIVLNGESRVVTDPRLDKVLDELGLADARVATAVNGDFVPAGRRDSITLADGDRVETLAPMQGG